MNLRLGTLLRPAALRFSTRRGYATTSSPGEKDYTMYYVGGGAAALIGLWYFTRDPASGPPSTRLGPQLTSAQEVKGPGEMKKVAGK